MLDDIFWMVSIEVGNNVCWGCLVVFLMGVSMCWFAAWVFPKIMVPPNHPLKNRVFHYFHHPVWAPLFLEIPMCCFAVCFQVWVCWVLGFVVWSMADGFSKGAVPDG